AKRNRRKDAAATGGLDMVDMAARYPSKGYFKADEFEDGDLVLQIESVTLGEPIGSNKSGDVVRFVNDGRALILNQINCRAICKLHGDDDRDWIGKWIMLYRDDNVKFEGEVKAGVRVLAAPQGNGAAAIVPPSAPVKDDLKDEIPF